MNVYVDASVLLRIVLGQSGTLEEWSRIERAIASEIIRVECLRTIDRARLRGDLDDGSVAARRAAVVEQLEHFDLVGVGRSVLRRAEDPFPTALGTLDALHLATAVQVRDQVTDLVLATHDAQLATGARAMGLTVIGG